MSFRCDSCGKPQKSGTKPTRIVVETRDVKYPGIRRGSSMFIPEGREIAREVRLCPKCVSEREQ